MELHTAVRLIESGVPQGVEIQQWADLGAGNGLFTKALATLLGKGSTVTAVDTDESALRSIMLPSKDVILNKIHLDFSSTTLEMRNLDGILMANSLHFIPEKAFMLDRFASCLHASGRLIVVEYNTNIANPWVPYPISFHVLQKLAAKQFNAITKIGETHSAYSRANMYAALLIP
ncbi:MAG: class I SAM-dependent methyltransferase [Cyclobacteriaceae bacterium]|nr:class I SAM-dependent methyltransferase [Cyclobacteriaceae bacterium]MDH4297995.1 class I SAM-dependent methyltransferase [Cyclobacteriaceae bacterium]MDH5249991.1 class I SAM-dependent methyltransferase [Cyclobacteriaceae bacterium]